MTYTNIKSHLTRLGLTPIREGNQTSVGDEFWNGVVGSGADMPEIVRSLFTDFAGCHFPQNAFYYDPKYQTDVMFGWLLDAQEIRDTFDWTRECLPPDVVPIANDGGDNHLALGVGSENSGVVYFHIHDAPLDRHTYVVNNSIEHFLLSLHPETASHADDS